MEQSSDNNYLKFNLDTTEYVFGKQFLERRAAVALKRCIAQLPENNSEINGWEQKKKKIRNIWTHTSNSGTILIIEKLYFFL